ncbi:hypothetical protein [Flavobacterium sp.]|uniref:hypothetical protein n=1 Tax=Flavobacterium sp. TaxID=239 RepID=UPI0028BDE1EF|nr:hypothetical protein [Flavobacterium sp.]
MRERKNEIPESVINIGKNITNIIKDKDLKITDVANKAQIDIETFRRYVGGSKGGRPSIVMGIDKLVRIAIALELDDYNELFKKS